MGVTIPEVLAQLDTFEQDLLHMAGRVREYRYMLFETLDNDPDGLVD